MKKLIFALVIINALFLYFYVKNHNYILLKNQEPLYGYCCYNK